MTIKDLIPGVRRKLRGRDDRDEDIPFYIKDAILDLTQNYEFEELKVPGPVTNFVTNQAVYSKKGSGNIFINPGDDSLTFISTWFVYYGTTVEVGVTTGMEMKGRAPRVIEPMSKILGIPSYYCIHGPNIIVGYLPNQAYACQMTYQRQHPFKQDSVISGSQVYIPDDWKEIVEYAAAEKGCDDIGMNDIGVLYHQKLYGNPQKRTPGIIMERESQQQRDLSTNETQLRVVVKRYCAR